MANACGQPKAARAVGNALNKNQYSYFENIPASQKIPCHRIVSSEGRIGGFSKGIDKKIVLLRKEGIEVRNGKILNFEKVLFKFQKTNHK